MCGLFDSASVNTVPTVDHKISRMEGPEGSSDWTWREVTPRVGKVKGVDGKSKSFTFVSFEVR